MRNRYSLVQEEIQNVVEEIFSDQEISIQHEESAPISKPREPFNLKRMLLLMLTFQPLVYGANKFLEEDMKIVCQMPSYPTFNNPLRNNLDISERRVGINQAGQLTSLACLQNNSEKCHKDLTLMKVTRPVKDAELKAIRDNASSSATQWRQKNLVSFNMIKSKLNDKQKIVFDEAFSQLETLNKAKVIRDALKNLKGGNCGEHTNVALLTLLESYNLDETFVIYRVLTISPALKHYINNHAYLMVVFRDSNNSPLPISNKYIGDSAQKLFRYFSETLSYVCDPWNGGLLVKLKEDKTNFYNNKLNSNVKLDKIFDLLELRSLTEEAYHFIKKAYQNLGLRLPDYKKEHTISLEKELLHQESKSLK